jgi:hypothetical protein
MRLRLAYLKATAENSFKSSHLVLRAIANIHVIDVRNLINFNSMGPKLPSKMGQAAAAVQTLLSVDLLQDPP